MVNPKDKEEDKGKSVPTSVVTRRVNESDPSSRILRQKRSEWKRRWRPYGRRFGRSHGKNYSSSSSATRFDEKESRKPPTLINLRMHVLSQPLAPYNTTQFLMDDHNDREPEFEQLDKLNEESDFIQRQFFETYEKINAERISTMSKADLVKEYLLLEKRCEELESKLKQMEYPNVGNNNLNRELKSLV